jgi:hypothetical protein
MCAGGARPRRAGAEAIVGGSGRYRDRDRCVGQHIYTAAVTPTGVGQAVHPLILRVYYGGHDDPGGVPGTFHTSP